MVHSLTFHLFSVYNIESSCTVKTETLTLAREYQARFHLQVCNHVVDCAAVVDLVVDDIVGLQSWRKFVATPAFLLPIRTHQH